jgi:AcrR family transcriptional regulator
VTDEPALEAGAPAPEPRGSGTGKRVRKNPDARRAEIVTAAREVFAEQGYASVALADVAAELGVSKALLYHYFPGGRPQLFVSVMEGLRLELQQRLRQAARVPFSVQPRLNHLLGGLFAFFDENPSAYRLLFRDPWASGDEMVEASALATRAQIAAELAAVMAPSGLPAEDLVAASSGTLGYALANVELCLAGQLAPERAWRMTCDQTTNLFGGAPSPDQ